MSSRTRLPERESDFTWEEPFRSDTRRRRPPTRRPPRKVALPVVGVALVLGLIVGFMAGGSGGSTTVTETTTVTTEAAAAAPTASGAGSRPDIDVAVLNGSGEAGLAARTGELLRGMGYAQVTEGNASGRVAADRVLYRAGAEAQALQVAADLGAGAPIPLADASGIAEAAPDADVVVVMGPSAASNAGQAGTAVDSAEPGAADAAAGGTEAETPAAEGGAGTTE